MKLSLMLPKALDFADTHLAQSKKEVLHGAIAHVPSTVGVCVPRAWLSEIFPSAVPVVAPCEHPLVPRTIERWYTGHAVPTSLSSFLPPMTVSVGAAIFVSSDHPALPVNSTCSVRF